MSSPPTTITVNESTSHWSGVVSAKPTLLLAPSRIADTLVFCLEPKSEAAERYRLLANAVERENNPPAGARVFAVTSPLPAEGKTVTALNLGFALAENRNQRVLVCDADLRRGSVAAALGQGEDIPGLSEFFAGTRAPIDLLLRLDSNLAVIPAGAPVEHPAGLFRQTGWRNLLVSLRDYFDIIILDGPPAFLSVDIGILDDVVDRYLMVVRAGRTEANAVREACGRVNARKLMGIVLNDADMPGDGYPAYGAYGSEPRKVY